MSSSRSSNRSDASQSQVTETTNLNLQDTSGIALAGNTGPVSISTTDFDAVSMAGEIGIEALNLGRRSVDNVVDFAGRGVDTIVNATRDVNRDSLDFAGRSLDSVARNSELAVDSISNFAQRAGDGVLDFASRLVGDSVKGLQSLSMQTSASTDDRVAKVAMYAFGAVAALVILPAVFKK